MKSLFAVLALFSLVSCGKDSPFDPKYYNEDHKAPATNNQSTTSTQTATAPVNGSKFKVDLIRVNKGVTTIFKEASANLEIDNTNVEYKVEFTDLQSNLLITDVKLQTGNCELLQVIAVPHDLNLTNRNTSNVGKRTNVFPELIANADLSKWNMVIYVNVKGTTTNLPVACGLLQATR